MLVSLVGEVVSSSACEASQEEDQLNYIVI